MKSQKKPQKMPLDSEKGQDAGVKTAENPSPSANETTASEAVADTEPTEDEALNSNKKQVSAETPKESSEAANSVEQEAAKDERDAQIAELTQQLLRTRADFDNFRRRTRQEKEELEQFATRKLLLQLLPVVDNFERALASFSEAQKDVSDKESSDLKTGIEMVHRQLLSVLEEHGVQSIEAVGQPFNPNFHEAVMQETVEGEEPGKIIAELQKGYKVHDKVLRPAMVKVTS